eukprot:2456470-Rhodomonas_salina.1
MHKFARVIYINAPSLRKRTRLPHPLSGPLQPAHGHRRRQRLGGARLGGGREVGRLVLAVSVRRLAGLQYA